LPRSARVCYKPCMRKWMRERLQRRKKTQEQKPPAEATPAPLQPAYYDAAESTPSEPEPQSELETQLPVEDVAPPEVSSAAAASSGQADPNEGRPKRRRRRGRGGRGGRGSPPSAPQAPLQPTLIHASETPEPRSSEAAPKAAETPVQALRAPKGVVILAIGLPGSGKSSWFKRHGITPLSSDALRHLLFDDANEQRFQDLLVFSNLRSMLKARLIARRPLNYVDATNLSQHDRHTWIKMARDYGYEVHAVFFDVPLEVCLERNQKRQRTLGEDVMRRMASKLRAPTFEEGFSKITVVRVKKKESA